MLFGTVDIRAIISAQAKKIAKDDMNAHLSSMKMKVLAENIETQIKDWGNNQGVILLAKASVVSGHLPDYTASVLEFLGHQDKAYEHE